MESSQQAQLQIIITQIDEYLAEEIGPVASILSEESLDYWKERLSAHGKAPGLRNLHIYVNKLANSLDDDAAKRIFLDKVLKIDAFRATLNSAGK